MQINRRILLAGAAGMLAATSLPRFALAAGAKPSRVARVITMFDASLSTNPFPANNIRKPNLLAWAQVMTDSLPGIIAASFYEVVEFEAYEWSKRPVDGVNIDLDVITTLIPRTILHRDNCTAACTEIAKVLREAANLPGKGFTNVVAPLRHALNLCDPSLGRNVINFVTDDNENRERPSEELRIIRNDAMKLGNTVINGMVMGNPHAMDNYVQNEIQTPGGFTLKTVNYATIEQAWQQKFYHDLA